MPLPQPKDIWKEILIDFITGLPSLLHRGIAYDAIFIIVDRYSKMVSFVLCNKKTTAEELTKIIKNEIIKHFDILSPTFQIGVACSPQHGGLLFTTNRKYDASFLLRFTPKQTAQRSVKIRFWRSFYDTMRIIIKTNRRDYLL